jgi:hypothetical protein
MKKLLHLPLFLLISFIFNFGLFSLLGKLYADAAVLTSGSVAISDSRPSTASVSYTLDFSNVTTSAIKCIKAVFSTQASGGSVPTGFTSTSAALSGSSDYIPTPASWSVNAATNGTVLITYATGETPASASGRTVILTGITNGSTADTAYYLQFNTYNNVDCSSSAVDSSTIAFIYTTGQAVSVTVDSVLTFTVNAVTSSQTVNGATTTVATTSTTIPFGTVTSSANAIAAHDLTISTNSDNGYTTYIRYTGDLTSGANTITDLATHTNASPGSFSAAGTEAFGYTTNDATLGTGTAGRFISDKWAAFDTTNYEVAYAAAPVSSETTRVGYQVGVSGSTDAGVYTTTVIITATPVY